MSIIDQNLFEINTIHCPTLQHQVKPMAKKTNLLLLLALSIVLFGCGPKERNMRLSSWVSSPIETQLFKETLASFDQAHPEIQYDFEPIAGNYSEKLQLMLGTNTSPDIFFLKGMVAPSYMSFKVLKPMDELMLNTADFDKDDFFPALLDAFNRDGVQYGLPKDCSPYVLFYNKKLFKEAGIDSLPTNWEELEAAAARLTKDLDGDGETDQFGIVLEPITEMVMPFVFQNGGAFQNPDGSLGITDDAFVEALEYYYGLYTKGYATLPIDVGLGWNGDAFGRGKAAMALSGGWLMPFLKENAPDLDYGVVELPAGKVKSTIVFTTALAMPERTQYLDHSWELVNYLTGKEGMKQWTSQGLAFPSRRSVAVENGFYEDPIYKVFMESLEFARPFQVEYSERGFEEIVVALQAVFYAGKSPREALTDIAPRIKKYKLTR